MNILNVITNNLLRGPLTLRFPKRTPTPGHFRGSVRLNSGSCIGCGTCAYVCASSAIRVRDYVVSCEWTYDAAQCTFCGRCADFCPTRALALEADRPPVYAKRGSLRDTHYMDYPPCPECGRPAVPVDENILAQAYGELNDSVRAWSRLCAHCRQRRDRFVPIETAFAAGRHGDGH